MTTFTSSLPDNLLRELDKTSKALKTPKNKLIEKALSFYLKELDKAAYKASFQRASNDKTTIDIAEEGMRDYSKMLEDFDNDN